MLTPREQQVLEVIAADPMISQRDLAERLDLSRSAVAGHVMRLTQKGALRGRGYVISEPASVVVVGGANIDIEGQASTETVHGDSNPGRIRRSPGGVGRNIAHNLANLGVATRLISVLGRDPDGGWLHEITASAGVDLAETLHSPRHTATYLSILDAAGEMIVAINDMSVLDDLDPQAIAERSATLSTADIVVADCNLSGETLGAVATLTSSAGAGALFVDTVSAAKAGRVAPHLDRVHTIKPNRIEAEVLTGVEITDDQSLHRAAEALLDKGVQRVVISLGDDGAYAADRAGAGHHHGPPSEVASVTGAGDALMAALVAAHLQELSLGRATRFALTAAAIAAASPHTIAADLTIEAISNLQHATPPPPKPGT